HALNAVAHSEGLTNKIFARALWEPLKTANNRALKQHKIPRWLAGWEGIPEYIDLPADKKPTERDVTDLTTNFIIPIQERIIQAELQMNPPEGIKDRRKAFNKWQTTLRKRFGFQSLSYEDGTAPPGSLASIPSDDYRNSESPSASRPHSSHQHIEGQESTAPGTASHGSFGVFQHQPNPSPPSSGNPESTGPETATPFTSRPNSAHQQTEGQEPTAHGTGRHRFFGDFRYLPKPIAFSSGHPAAVTAPQLHPLFGNFRHLPKPSSPGHSPDASAPPFRDGSVPTHWGPGRL
ncbi:hypothetical protein H0H93_011974, partial [Arthromyces matolae]